MNILRRILEMPDDRTVVINPCGCTSDRLWELDGRENSAAQQETVSTFGIHVATNNVFATIQADRSGFHRARDIDDRELIIIQHETMNYLRGIDVATDDRAVIIDASSDCLKRLRVIDRREVAAP